MVPAIDGGYFSDRQKEALWDRFFTGAPHDGGSASSIVKGGAKPDHCGGVKVGQWRVVGV
jgi:hypothetical protein